MARRFLHEYGVLTPPLLEWEDLQDLAVDEAGEEGLPPRVFVRARGFGNAYHPPVAVTPSKCEARGEGEAVAPSLAGA